MPWVKLDDHFPENPKVAAVGPLGLALWVSGIAYCNRALTDGLIPRSIARTLLDWTWMADGKPWSLGMTGAMTGYDIDSDMVLEVLVEHGLFEETRDGYRIHDYLDFQPSRHDVLVARERERGKKRRQRSPNSVSPGDNQGDTPGDSLGYTPGSPAAPVPVPKVNKEHPPSPLKGEAVDVFNVFRETWSPTARLTDKRRRLVKARLKEGFTTDDLTAAIRGAKHDLWADRPKFATFEILLRDAEHIERFIAMENGTNGANGAATIGQPGYKPTTPGEQAIHQRIIDRG